MRWVGIRILLWLQVVLVLMAALSCKENGSSSGGSGMQQDKVIYYYEMPQGERRELLNKADALRIGDSDQAIIRQLGRPTYDQKLIDKKDVTKRIRVLKYYVKKKDNELVNELYDQYIRLELSPAETLLKVQYINIQR